MKEKTDKVSSLQTSKEVEQVTSLSDTLNDVQGEALNEAQSGRLTLGFLTPGIQIDSRFHEAWMGVCDAARD